MNAIGTSSHQPWNKRELVWQKAPPRLKDIWAIRVRLQIAEETRDLALFDLAIDSKLRACVGRSAPAYLATQHPSRVPKARHRASGGRSDAAAVGYEFR